MAIASYPSATRASTAPAAPPVAPAARRAWSVLAVSTLAFTVCFMVWMMFAVIGIPIRQALNLNATEFGLLTAMPVLTGSLIRVPLGIWTDRYGGRIVMAVLMAVTVPAIWLMAYATAYCLALYTAYNKFMALAHGINNIGEATEKLFPFCFCANSYQFVERCTGTKCFFACTLQYYNLYTVIYTYVIYCFCQVV